MPDLSFREYVDLKIAHEREIREEWRIMNDKMVESARSYVDAKLEKMNEMREQINQERSSLLNRAEYTVEHKALESRVGVAENQLSNYQGRLIVVGGIWGLIVIVIAGMIAHFWK